MMQRDQTTLALTLVGVLTGLFGKLSLIMRQLELDTSKTHQDKCECYGVLSRGEVEEVSILVYWMKRCSGLVYASYLKYGTRSSGLAKSKLALLQLNPTSLLPLYMCMSSIVPT